MNNIHNNKSHLSDHYTERPGQLTRCGRDAKSAVLIGREGNRDWIHRRPPQYGWVDVNDTT